MTKPTGPVEVRVATTCAGDLTSSGRPRRPPAPSPTSRSRGASSRNQWPPRKLGHAVLGSTDFEAAAAFFVMGLGFKVSD
jgi:hypothetical protein